MPARAARAGGLSRTFQTSRLFGGLTVEDNLYLAVLGVGEGHLRLVALGADEEMRERGRAMAEAVGLAGGSTCSWPSSRTASSASSRSAWRAPPSRS